MQNDAGLDQADEDIIIGEVSDEALITCCGRKMAAETWRLAYVLALVVATCCMW